MVNKGYFGDSRPDERLGRLLATWLGSKTTGLLTLLGRPGDKFAVPLSEQDFEPLASEPQINYKKPGVAHS
jgi:hypothetical protein